MIGWIRGRRPDRTPTVDLRTETLRRELSELVQRREREAAETVEREASRREQLSGAFIYDVMQSGTIEKEGGRP